MRRKDSRSRFPTPVSRPGLRATARGVGLALALALALLWLAACTGGSGSSGFDISPENAAISQALAERRCIDRAGLTICPVDEASGAEPGSPATDLRIDTALGEADFLACLPPGETDTCSFTVAFAPLGFPPETSFRVAVRTLDPTDDWMIGSQPAGNGTPTAPSFDAPVSLATPVDAMDAVIRVQLAVLVFPEPAGDVPGSVTELADSGAAFAFVTDELSVQVVE